MKAKFKILIIALLAVALSVMVLAACANSGNKIKEEVIEGDLPDYDYNKEAAFGEAPDENIRIDGRLDEALWQNLSYMSHTDPQHTTVTVNVTTHFSPKGLYIGAYSSDSKVFWNGKNYYHWNTHFVFRIASAGTTEYSASVRNILIDANNVFPGATRVNAKSKVLGDEVNSGTSDGLSVEMFITWDALGIEVQQDENGVNIPPENVKLYWRYRYVSRNNGTNSPSYDIRNTFDYNADILDNYTLFGPNGYTAEDRDGAEVGNSVNGNSKSAGWDISGEEEGTVRSTNGYYQGIFFKNAYANSFVITTKIKPISQPRANYGSKAGLLLYKDSMNYRGIVFDTSAANRDGSKIRTDNIFAVTHYPDNAYNLISLNTGKNITYPSGQELVELKVIKNNDLLYYVVNGKLVATEKQDYLAGNVVPGLYSTHGVTEFTDYSFVNFDGNDAALKEEIAKYAYTITAPSVTAYSGGYVTASKLAIGKNDTEATVEFTFTTRSGYILSDVTKNGTSIMADIKQNAVGNVYTLTNITENVVIEAVFTQLSADQSVTVSGRLRGNDRADAVLDYAMMNITAETPDGDSVSVYNVEYTADAKGLFTLKLVKGYKYTIEVQGSGYRKKIVETEVINADIADDPETEGYEGLEIIANANVVGGSVNKTFEIGGNPNDKFTVTAASNVNAWDLSREAESIASLHANTPTGMMVYFTGKAGTEAVLETTITNITDTELYGDYERDPSAGFIITDGKTNTFIGLLRNGLRFLPTGGWNGDQFDEPSLVSYATVNATKDANGYHSTKLKVIRTGPDFYVYIDDVLVYTYTSSNFLLTRGTGADSKTYDTPTAFGFWVTTSYPITIQFSDYRCLTDDEAHQEILDTIYSRPEFVDDDSQGVTLEGLSDGMVKQGGVFTASKDVKAGEAYYLTVYGSDAASYTKYLLTETSKSVEVTAMDEGVTNIKVEKASNPEIVTVTGKIVTSDNKKIESGTVFNAYFDGGRGIYNIDYSLEDGSYSIKIPKGTYELSAYMSGYFEMPVTVEITKDGALSDYVLPIANIGGKVRVNGVTYTTDAKWRHYRDGLQATGTPGNISFYVNDVTATEYAVTMKTRISGGAKSKNDKGELNDFNLNNPYYSTDNVQGISIMDGSRQLNIMIYDSGFRVLFGGWNTVNMVETAGTGWNFFRDGITEADDYVDIVMTVVRRGSILYVYVGNDVENGGKGVQRDMQLYLTISAEDGVVPYSVNGVTHKIKDANSESRMAALKKELAPLLKAGVSNGLGYTLHMDTSKAENVNYSFVYGASVTTAPAEIDKVMAVKIAETCGEGGSISYSGEGYVADGAADKYLMGKDITVTLVPDAEKQVKSLTVNGTDVEFTADADGKVAYVANVNGPLTVAAEFEDKTYTAYITGVTVGNFNALQKVVATSGDKSLELKFETLTIDGKRIVEIQIPKGTWSVALINRSGNTFNTVSVTISGTETEIPSFAV